MTKDEIDALPPAIVRVFKSNIIPTVRTIERKTKELLRNFIWDELAPHWDEYLPSDSHDLALTLLCTTRLSHMLQADEGFPSTIAPAHMHIFPPVIQRLHTTCIIKRNDTYSVILTPACDFEQKKASNIILCKALLLSNTSEFNDWHNSESKTGRSYDKLKVILGFSSSDRYFYLPAFRDIPHLVFDFQNIEAVDKTLLETELQSSLASIVSTLAPPFSEALLSRFSRYSGRIGVPDLDRDAVKETLKTLLPSTS